MDGLEHSCGKIKNKTKTNCNFSLSKYFILALALCGAALLRSYSQLGYGLTIFIFWPRLCVELHCYGVTVSWLWTNNILVFPTFGRRPWKVAIAFACIVTVR